MSQPDPGTGRHRATLSVELPAGWYFKESITALAPDGQANVIASTEPLDPSIDTDRYAAGQGDLLRNEFPGYEELHLRHVTLADGTAAWERRFRWTPPDGVAVEQIQLYHASGGRGFTATATTPTSQTGRFEDTFASMLGSLRRNPTPEVAPVSLAVVVAAMTQQGYAVDVVGDRAVRAAFELDPTSTGRDQLVVIIEPLAGNQLSIRARIVGTRPAADRWWEMLALANEWNARSLSVVQAAHDPQSPAEIDVTVGRIEWLPAGAGAAQVAGVVHRVLEDAARFWTAAHAQQL